MFDTVWSDIFVWTSSFNISIYLQHGIESQRTCLLSCLCQRRLAGDERPISSLKIDNEGGWNRRVQGRDLNGFQAANFYGEQIRHFVAHANFTTMAFVTGFQFVAMLMRQGIINQDQISGGPRLFLAYNPAWAEGEVGPPIHPQQLISRSIFKRMCSSSMSHWVSSRQKMQDSTLFPE